MDGKTVRGSRREGGSMVHPLAAALHDTQTVIAQRQVTAKSNEIQAFAPLLEGLNLRSRRPVSRARACARSAS
jgi:hypothetical protein